MPGIARKHGRHAGTGRTAYRSERAALYIFAGWLAFVFFTGGGSRHDIESLVVLRPLSLIAVAASAWLLTGNALRDVRFPLILLGALGVLMALQLVPLPPSIWQSLWNRELIASLSEAAGIGDVWRPLTLSPMKTANALASLAVPLATLLLYAAIPVERCSDVWWVILAAAVFSAVLGLAQTALGGQVLYFYDITNRGEAVGLFSNRNHQAVFLAMAILICARLLVPRLAQKQWGTVAGLAIAALFLTVVVLVNGSRAGLLTLGLVWTLSAIWIALKLRSAALDQAARRYLRLGAIALGVGVAALAALFIISGASGSSVRLAETSAIEETRLLILPTLLDMARDAQPWGIGFGAFEYAYRMVEPADLLTPNYLNNAHNDWLQIVIEGGVPGILIALAALFVVFRKAMKLPFLPLADEAQDGRADDAKLAFLLLLVFGVASIVDYPLRVPSMMAVGIVCLAMLSSPALSKIRGDARV